MAFIDWKADYTTGLPEIDDQHQRLVELVNQIQETAKLGGPADRLITVIDQLISYTQGHFAREEELMKRMNYSGLSDHARRHCAMMIQSDAFRNEIACGNVAMSRKLTYFLRDWLDWHILESGKYCRRRTAARPAA